MKSRVACRFPHKNFPNLRRWVSRDSKLSWHMLPLHIFIAGGNLRLGGSDPQVVFGNGATLRAECASSSGAKALAISPRVFEEAVYPSSKEVTVHLANVPTTCARVSSTLEPCASKDDKPTYPRLFFCAFSGEDGEVTMGPYAAETFEHLSKSGVVMDTSVQLVCPIPSFDHFRAVTGYAQDGASTTLRIAVKHGDSLAVGLRQQPNSTGALPWSGVAEGNILTFAALSAPPPPTQPPPPASPPKWPSSCQS